jgi:hypothetical protein
LYGQGAYDGGDDGADDLQHLEYFLPVDFHFTQNKFKRNTLLIKGHTDYTDYTDFLFLRNHDRERTNIPNTWGYL